MGPLIHVILLVSLGSSKLSLASRGWDHDESNIDFTKDNPKIPLVDSQQMNPKSCEMETLYYRRLALRICFFFMNHLEYGKIYK